MWSSSRSSSRPVTQAAPRWLPACLIALAVFAQATFLHGVQYRGAVFSPALVLLIWYALAGDVARTSLLGLLAGFLEDIVSGVSGGAWTLSTTLTAVAVALTSRGFFADSIPLVAGLVAGGTLLRNMLFWSMMRVEGYPPGLGVVHFHQTLWQALLNALLVTAVLLLGRFYRERMLT